LRDIARINRLFGGHRTMLNLLGEFVEPADVFSILDVGAASGDIGKCIVKRYGNAKVTSLDRVCLHLTKADPPKVAGDAFALPFADGSFEFVMCSLFLHHFSDGQVAELLCSFRTVARRAVLAIDLERGPLAYRFIPATKWLFGWHDISLYDGPASVRAAFKKDELLALAFRAGLDQARVNVHRPWARLSLVAPVAQAPGLPASELR